MTGRRSFRLGFRTVQQPRRPAPLPDRADWEAGAYLWAADGSEDCVPLQVESPANEEPAMLPLDPEVEQHLDLALHHPGFLRRIEELRRSLTGRKTTRKTSAAEDEIARVAHEYRVSPATVRAAVSADEHDLELDVLEDLTFVEVRPALYVIRVPRPLTQRRRAALRQWLAVERTWLDKRSRSAGRVTAKRASVAPGELAAMEWFERWLAGESIPEITDSVRESMPLGPGGLPRTRPFESDVKDPVRRLWKRMRAISPEGLPEHGP